MPKEIIQWCVNLLEITTDSTTPVKIADNITKEVIEMLEYYKSKEKKHEKITTDIIVGNRHTGNKRIR